MPAPSRVDTDRGSLTAERITSEGIDDVVRSYAANGYAIVSGVFDEAEIEAAESELAAAQRQLVEGTLEARHATAILDDPHATVDGRPFAHYVCFATEVSAAAHHLAYHPTIVELVQRLIGPRAWLLDDDQFGVVYQDARPERGSGYSRIGWHTDHQSGPHLDMWPGVAFTVHFDATSPANGFLRVVPGSHLGGTEGLPPTFERVDGEIALYAERGEVLFHHCDLWHAAARATADGPLAVRRHLRGSWHAGQRLEPGHGTDDFVKNAAR
jgi:ectoine hydroxylase-related dioxygenase (phytanoyl-CoA dioxygenase family)